jgi:SET domain-containing protein
MLLVATRLGISPIPDAGIGVFVTEPVAQGQLVWQFHPHADIFYTESQWRDLEGTLHAHSFANIKRLSYKQFNLHILSIDNAQFMNHSDVPNVIDAGTQQFAAFDLEPGAELLCDYRQFCDQDDYNLEELKRWAEAQRVARDTA